MLEQAEEGFLRRVAKILGCSSAAAQALAERDRRRAAGEDAVVLWDRDRGGAFLSAPGRKPARMRPRASSVG